MATVQGLTKDRMLAIEAASVVDGEINGSGHLILTRHDGSTIDAGDALLAVPPATTTLNGVVELATTSETIATTDSVRAVTPSGLAGVILKTLATNAIAETALITDYPVGISQMAVGSGSGWSLNTGFGLVVTHYYTDTRSFQFFHAHTANSTWKRYWYQGVWGAWTRFATTTYLAAMDTTQQLVWGTDTNLYRASADVLKTDDQFQAAGVIGALNGINMPNTKQFLVGTTATTATLAVQRGSATDYVLGAQVGSETNRRYLQQADGSQYWGDGTNAVDVKQYRSGSNRLATDGRYDQKPMTATFSRATAATLANGGQTATYDTTVDDFWSIGNSSGVVTIPTGWGGLWTFTAGCYITWVTNTTSVGFRLLLIAKNGNVIDGGEMRVNPNTVLNQPTSLSVTVDDVVAAGDLIRVDIWHTQGAGINLTYKCRFTLTYKGRVS